MRQTGYRKIWSLLWCLVVCCCFVTDRAWALDANGDGIIRIAVVAQSVQPGEVLVEKICSDLESMVKAAVRTPVRVTLFPIESTRTLLGWWYHPASAESLERLRAGNYDYMVMAESDSMITAYPEFYFEGVRCLTEFAHTIESVPLLLLLSQPGTTFRDTRYLRIAELAYRVGNGCNIGVVPAAFCWGDALTRNRFPGESMLRARASAFLAAAAIYTHITDRRVAKGAQVTDWITPKDAALLLRSVGDGLKKAHERKHFVGSFAGVVRVATKPYRNISVYVPNASDDDLLGQNLQFILECAGQKWFWRTPNHWYQQGFDMFSLPFDLVYGDMQQMNFYLVEPGFTSIEKRPSNFPEPLCVVFSRNPVEQNTGEYILANMEQLLFDGYDFAKNNNLVFLPYQLAWARAHQADRSLTGVTESGREGDWLQYMLANMVYTAVTGRFQAPAERQKPGYSNMIQPQTYYEKCARIGYETMTQLATLQQSQNAVLLRGKHYTVSKERPGFVSVRLLNKPGQGVRVLCATDKPGLVELSQETLHFTPDNYDIEQTLRILPIAADKNVLFNFMCNTISDDPAAHNRSAQQPFLLQHDVADDVSVDLKALPISPEHGYMAEFSLSKQPVGIVRVEIVQGGRVTEEVYCTPGVYQGLQVRICPGATDYQAGRLQLGLRLSSTMDMRFEGVKAEFTLPLSSNGKVIPHIEIKTPLAGSSLEGPAFVTGEAVVEGVQAVSALEVYLGHKRLGKTGNTIFTVPVEQGPPQSRLPVGEYTLWAKVVTIDGLVVISPPVSFKVHER